MLIKLAPDEVRLGMFVHSYEGRWNDRPYWQSGFLLTEQADLDRLHQSRIGRVVIDSEKGKGRLDHAPRRPRASRKPMNADTKRAAKAIERSRVAILSLSDDIRLGRPIQVARLAPLVSELASEIEHNAGALLGLLRIKSRDQYTYLHSVAVAALMMNLARTMGVDETMLPEFGLAGLLHDAGKIAIPEHILNKPAALSETEFRIMRSHPSRGHHLLSRAAGVPSLALDVCLHHHERPDGRGYPEGLGGDDLSDAARMGAICDVYDALTSNRAYKDAWSPQRAILAMLGWHGQFDAKILRKFIDSLGIYPAGTLVSVRGSSLALVLEDNDEEPTCPTVRSFYSIPGRCRVRSEDIALKSTHVLALEDPVAWGFDDWSALSAELRDVAMTSPNPTYRDIAA